MSSSDLRGWLPTAAATLAIPATVAAVGAGLHAGGWFVGPAAGAWGVLTSPVFLLILTAELLAWGLSNARSATGLELALWTAPGFLVFGGVAGVVDGVAERDGYLVAGAFLVGWFTVLLQYVYRHKQLAAAAMSHLRELTLLSILAGAGWFLWALDGSPVVWAATGVVAAFVVARGLTARRADSKAERVPWLLRPLWAVELLLFTFLAEFFAGALLDLELSGRTFLQFIPFVPIAGPWASVAGLSVYDGLWFAAAILASAWFLVALGVTMGALVVLRMREVHVPAQRYRMGLMLGFYALAAVFVPSLASSTPLISNKTLASLPLIGWGFGLRSGGPFESGIFLAILVMYASVGVLTVLFGRKALCSVMCGAAIMYQGTTMHEMRQFNQTSRIGQYYLGSRLSTAYVVASVLALSSLFAVSLLSYLHRLPTVQVANGEYDTSALPLPVELYFGGLWFAMFVATPYVGTYNCATTGVCHWGSLSVPFTKVSFFRLRVKDKEVCRKCTTFDCAKACPVGLVDMPLHFRESGEYRSSKCCGVGDCVGACPYGNMYHEDVRNWIAKVAARLSRNRPGPALPMVPTARPTASPAAPAAELRARGPG